MVKNRWDSLRTGVRNAVILGVLLAVSLMTVPAEARTTRVSHGDVRSILNASINGNHGNHTSGPSDLELRGSIRPIAGTPWDGRHFCVDDWHVLLFADIQPSRDNFSTLTFELVLDGIELATERTPVKRFISPTREELYAVQAGTIFAPGGLGVGEHSLTGTSVGFDGVNTDAITFFVDPSGTGACL